jgi:hypothetical protein
LWSRLNFSLQLKHSPRRCRSSISAGDMRLLAWPSAKGGAGGGGCAAGADACGAGRASVFCGAGRSPRCVERVGAAAGAAHWPRSSSLRARLMATASVCGL